MRVGTATWCVGEGASVGGVASEWLMEEDPTLVFSSLGGDLEEMVNHSDSSVSTMGLLLWLSERGLGWTDIIVTKVHSGSSCGALCVREWS